MSIAAVAMVLNEADIIETSIRHLFAEGIDEMYLAVGECDDGTESIIERLGDEYPIRVFADEDKVWHQTAWTNRLIETAGNDGHTWICPWDIDEFIYGRDGRTIAENLTDCPHDKLLLHQFAHHDWNTREVDPRRLPKVVFRYSPGVQVSMGSHECTLPGGAWDILDLREWQFRDFSHFCRKVRERNARLDPIERARGNGTHMTSRDGMSDDELRVEWNALLAIPTIADPIPSRIR